MSESVIRSLDGGVLTLTMSRAEARNALDADAYRALTAAVTAADRDASVGEVIVTGAGGHFTAGNDLKDFQKPIPAGDAPGIAYLRALTGLGKPLLAAVEGVAVGIGITMLLHCDFAWAGEGAPFGIDPIVAMLSYSTGESGKGEDVDRVREATIIAREKAKETFPGLKIEGPIQYDAAVDPSVAKTKMPGSEVAGRATVLIFPDLNTGNNTYKAVQRSAGAVAIGPVLQGLKHPVNVLSRGCTITDIVNTVAITAIQAQAGKKSG